MKSGSFLIRWSIFFESFKIIKYFFITLFKQLKKFPVEFITLAIFLALYYYTFPRATMMYGDEFGYFDGLVKSIRGNIFSSPNFLAPTNIGFQFLGSVVYKLTNNFFLASYGVVCFSYLLVGIILYFLLRQEGFSVRNNVFILVFLMAHPYIIDFSSEYHGFATYLVFILLGVYFSSRNQLLFCIAFVAAFLIRQSAVFLLILPAFDCLKSYLKDKKVRIPYLTSIVVLVIITVALIKFLPKSYAASIVLKPREFLSIDIFKNLIIGIYTLAPVALVVQVVGGAITLTHLKKNWTRNVTIFVFALLLSLVIRYLFGFDISPIIYQFFFIPLLGTYFKYIFELQIVALLFLNYECIQLNRFMVASLGSLLLVSSKTETVAPRYLVDAIILLALSLCSTSYVITKEKFGWRKFYFLLFMILIGFFGIEQKNKRSIINCKVYEQAFRNGLLNETDASCASFGVLGWKFHEYYVKNDASLAARYINGGCNCCFLFYIHKDVSGLFIKYVDDGWDTQPNHVILLQGRDVIGFRKVEYRLLKNVERSKFSVWIPRGFKPIPVWPCNLLEIKKRCIPLSNAEWNQFIKYGRCE